MFVAHPLLPPETVEDRGYQRALADKLLEHPTLLVLPTGLGKTVVALRALLQFLDRDSTRRILFLAPTKPLVDQHGAFLRRHLPTIPAAVLTGETGPAQRLLEWKKARIIVATPQVVQNDLLRQALDLSDVGFIVFDEAHRATGNYPYGFIAQRYRAAGGTAAAGLTASPGNDAVAVQRVLENLHLTHVEVRSERDPDVAPYVHEITTEWVRVRPTRIGLQLIKLLERMYARCVLSLRQLGFFPMLKGLPTRKDVLDLGRRLRAEASQSRGGRTLYEAVSLQARALKIQHALELAETQGTHSTHGFLARIELEATSAGGTKASRDFLREPEFLEALTLARDDPDPSPKQVKVMELVRESIAAGHRRVLVFANYRETADALVGALETVPGVRASRFVGHAPASGERGMTQREQERIVERFRQGDYNVLVATAVGEEGLDLPETDLVVLHEPVPSGIRMIQRRGRTGRQAAGRHLVLLMEGTRDESYQWSAMRRERRMQSNLVALRRAALTRPLVDAAQPVPVPTRILPSLNQGLELVMDPREATSSTARGLLARGIRVKTSPLHTGDYAVSDHILVERKTAADFLASLKDGRLFEQLPRLARSPTGILLIEGDPYRVASGVSPSALSGALAAAAADHHVSIVPVPDAEVAADFLVSLARREHREGRTAATRLGPIPRAPEAQLRFILEGVPGVGPVLARRLLERYGSIAAVVNASESELQDVEGVGVETARGLHEAFHRPYREAAPSRVGAQTPLPTLEGGDCAAGVERLYPETVLPTRALSE